MDTAQKKYSINRLQASKLLAVSARTIDRYIRSGRLSCNRHGNKVLLCRHELGILNEVKNRLEAELNAGLIGQVDRQVDRNVYLGRGKVDNVDSNVYIANRHIKGDNTKQVDSDVYRHSPDVDKDVYMQRGDINRRFDRHVDTLVDIDNSDMDNTVYVEKRKFSLSSQNKEMALIDNVYKLLYDEAKEEIREKQKKLEGANYRVGQLESQIKNMVPLLEYQREQRKLLSQGEMFESEKRELVAKIYEKEEGIRSESLNRRIMSFILILMLIFQPIFWLLWRIYHG